MAPTFLECSLCGVTVPSKSVQDGNGAFCCHGCHAVYKILATKNELGNYKDHPLFQQAVRAGLISNPALLEAIQKERLFLAKEETLRLQIEIQDMWCPSCAEVVKWILSREKGIKMCVVDYATDLALIEYVPRYTAKEAIFQSIRQLGYSPVSLEDRDKEGRTRKFHLYIRFMVAAFFASNIMMFAYPLYSTYFSYDDQGVGSLFAWLSLGASLPVVTYSAWPILKRFIHSLKMGLFGMETLVVLGVSSALGLSIYELYLGSNKVYFDSMTVIIAFMLLGKIIESKAKNSAKETLYQLNKALPKRARKKFPDGRQDFVPIKEVNLEDSIVALTGEKIVLDGIVIEGRGCCDESLVSGEAFPVTKQTESRVIAGAVVVQGWITYKVTAKQDTSTLQQIISLVEQELVDKPQYVRAADSIVRGFIPMILLISIAAALYAYFNPLGSHPSYSLQEAVIRAISVLLISCPCAIGIAAPLAESYLLNTLAKEGVIIRNRGCLRALGKETVYAFDKTGTVTQGKLSVVDGLCALSPYEKSILKSMAAYSNHPVAISIYQGIEAEEVLLDKVEEYAGKGIKGIFKGLDYYLGSDNFLQHMGFSALNVNYPDPEASIVSVAFLGLPEGKVIPIFCADKVKEEINALLKQLQPAKTILLSGDSKNAVQQTALACGFDAYYWHMSPLQKQEFINQLREEGQVVCMIGDGINDAPALSAAQVGISVLSATDISIQVSDIFLTTDKLSILPCVQRLARKTAGIVNQNLFWAFFYNIIGVGLAFFGWLSPLFSAFAMIMSSLIVILNSQRLSKHR